MRRYIVLVAFLLLGIPVHSAQAAAAYCLRLFQTPSFTDQIFFPTQTLNVQTGKLTTEGPVIPPNGAFSADGRYAAFMEITQLPSTGLYAASVATNEITLLAEYDMGQDVENLPPKPLIWAWSPTSDRLAYISLHRLFIYNAATGKTQSAPLEGAGNLVMLDGWSADGQYVAASTSTNQAAVLNIFSADGLPVKQVDEALTPDEEFGAAAWSLRGHQLGVTVGKGPVQLVIWSPENGVIALTNVDSYDGGYLGLLWLPGDRYLRLRRDQDLGYYNDYVFGFDGKHLYQPPPFLGSHSVIGAVSDGSVILLDSSDEGGSRLYALTYPSAVDRTIDTDVDEPYGQGEFRLLASPDQSHFIYFTDRDGFATAYSSDGQHVRQISGPDFVANYSFDSYDLTWSPQGKYAAIRIYGYETPGRNLTVIVTPDGRIKRVVNGLLDNWIDDNLIDYEVWVGDQQTATVVMNIDTGQSWTISPVYDRFTALSPDKTVMALAIDAHQLGILPLKAGATVIPISGNAGYANGYQSYVASWSPDSAALAFIGDSEVRVVSRDGTLIRETKVDLQESPILQWIRCP